MHPSIGFLWRNIHKLGAVALIANVSMQAWQTAQPAKPVVSSGRAELVEVITPAILNDLKAARGETRAVLILPLKNDANGYLTDHLRDSVGDSGILNVADKSRTERLRAWLGSPPEVVSAADQAVAAAKGRGSPAVLFGEVHAFEAYNNQARIDVDLKLVEVSTGKLLLERRYTQDNGGGGAAQPASDAGPFYWTTPLLISVAFVLLFPVFTVTYLRGVVKKQSNTTNASTLFLYTLIDAIIAYLLLGAGLTSWLAVLVFLLLIAGAIAYNVYAMTFALQLES